MAISDFPDEYLNFNDQSTKKINVVVEIDGVDTFLSLSPLFKRARYGDPDLHYGDPGLVYGGVVPYRSSAFKSLLSLESNLTISQRLEPEQGKAAVSTMTLVFVDIDQYMTQLFTPGFIIDEPLGNKFVKVKIGYQETSYPEDYITIFRGYLTDTRYSQGKYYVQISDPNSKRRGQVFFTPQNTLTSSINNSVTTIPFSTADYYDQILGPNGGYDSTVKTYVKIDDEVIQYGPGGLGPTGLTGVTRGVRGTTAASHNSGAEVNNTIELSGNVIDIALKMMMSGFAGNWLTDVPVLSIQDTLGAEGIVNNAILLPIGKNASDDYGLVPGDYVTFSGSGSGNNGTKVITEIQSVNDQTNNLVLFSTDFVATESPPCTTVMAFRSQYDTYPIAAGLMLTPMDVDVARHVSFRNDFFSQDEYRMRFYQQEATRGKDFIEAQLMLPIGSYSITRFGRISMTMARPPIADDLLHTLDVDSVIEPNTIQSDRAINTRMYFNEIKYTYDLGDDGNYASVLSIVDTLSLSKITIPSVLPIQSDGMKTDLGSVVAINRRGKFLIDRYKNAAIVITIKTNWKTGSIIETGDVVLVNDNGQLQITNFETGERNLGQQLFEVIDRQYDIKNGTVQLKIMSGLGFKINDRFATISPSSLVTAGSSTTQINFEDSFGALFPGDEKAKWEPLVGMKVFVHSYDYSNTSNEVTLLAFDQTKPYVMNVSPALSYTPAAGDIIEVSTYPNSTDNLDQALLKLLFCYLDPTVAITSGISTTQFQVGAGDIGKFTVGLPLLVRNSSYSVYSDEALVDTIDTGTDRVTTKTSLGVNPSDMQFSEGIGFIDDGGPYRFI